MMTATICTIWEARRTQSTQVTQTRKREMVSNDKEIDKLLDLIIASGDPVAIQKHEEKIAQHEQSKARLTEKLSKLTEPKGSFEKNKNPHANSSQPLG